MMNALTPPMLSGKSLLAATFIAITLAGLVLLTMVLPAEYGFDPTGLGQKMGLTVLANQNQTNAEAIVSSCQEQLAHWTDSITLIVPAKSGLEYKFNLQKDASLDYSWTTDGAAIYYDLHGEPKGDTSGYFKSFQVNTEKQSTGSVTALFEGPHGWYWENKSQFPVTILLQTKGIYQKLGLM
jgi:hypothetical protein